MATTSAPRTWAAVTRRALAVTGAATVALVALALPASAHTPKWSAGCDAEKKTAFVTVDLKNYSVPKDSSPTKVNSAVLTDGTKVLINDPNFGRELTTTIELDPTVTHNLHLVVTAYNNNPEKGQNYNLDDTKVVEACVEKAQPPAEQPPAEQPPAAQPPAETPPAPATTTTAAVGVNANLAETGASIALPIGIGAVLLLGGAGLLLVLRRRDRSGKA
ncbi:LPXTG cell wall anchor domain-containing protein [Actinophytocola sp.]|uniref:LPXTG cell wall anchor domain-containing protein n=1 Tax=Actinophytocola sp. TaxID=1872138 RepID=UPI002D802778|nr:LPXTG cell wall anchor domain-containing protein [Actinophytocola sp.]HET9141805.1 LPXTG cell wall anchor domain-containing protein [Actinophytocola sp.]